MSAKSRILLVDDDPAVLVLLQRRLEALDRFEVSTAEGGKAALGMIPVIRPDLVVLDIDMPDLDGGSVAAALEADPRWAKLPLIFLSALVTPGETRAGDGIVGGWPMLSKREPVQHLVDTMESLLARFPMGVEEEIEKAVAARTAEILEENARLAQASVTDPLTGLLNRRAFLAGAEAEEARWRRSGHPFSIVFLDLDHFKAFNDTWGHACGDAVLKQLAGILTSETRKQDLVARWGGEEFILLAPNTHSGTAVQLAEKVRAAVEGALFTWESHPLDVRLTLGVAGIREGGTAADCIKAADDALYQGKQAGRNRVVLHTPPKEA